ncbi:MAG TPA: DUF4214 domain-containing protein, partial [Gemmataceae bacterium]|nr:DUF4214 domain-containing protein [Gemmataceae bacterium]
GRLTVAAAAGAVNVKINYIDISPVLPPAPLQQTASVGISQTLATNSLAPANNSTSSVQTVWLRHLYHDMLGRDIAQWEVDVWVKYFQTGGTLAAGANAIVISQEHRTFASTLCIQDTFSTYLHRAAAPGEVTNWLNNFAAGFTTNTLVTALVNSAEYANRVGSSNSQWIAGIYQDMLGRSAVQSDIDAWNKQFNKGATRLAVTNAILTGTEYKTRQNILWTNQIYNTCLGRNPTAAELSSALTSLNGGGATDAIVNKLLSSQEYYNQVVD